MDQTADRRAQLANNATTVFITLNAGGLAAALAWMQSIPLEPDQLSCNSVLLTRVPWVCALLLGGVLTAAASYLVRYRSGDPGKVQIGWQVALSLSAGLLLVAGALMGHTVGNCRSLAFDAMLASDVQSSIRLYESLPADQKAGHWDALAQHSARNSIAIHFAVVEDSFKDRVEVERKLQRTRDLKDGLARRLSTSSDRPSKKLKEELQGVTELEQRLTEYLSE